MHEAGQWATGPGPTVSPRELIDIENLEAGALREETGVSHSTARNVTSLHMSSANKYMVLAGDNKLRHIAIFMRAAVISIVAGFEPKT